jgi:hypothetical protein
MKRSLLAAALLAATATTTLAASVPTKPLVLRTAGYWSASYSASNSEGLPMCVMQSDMDLRGGGNASLMFKYTPGGQLFAHVFKTGWQIPKDTVLSVALVFDGGEPWATKAARGSSWDSNTGLIAFVIRNDSVQAFLTEFGEANSMKLQFTDGTERPWSFNMIGSKEVSLAFAECIVAISKPTSTQPYGNSGARTKPRSGPTTQPFGAQPNKPLPVPGPKDDGGI